MYVGGTVAQFAQATEPLDGVLDLRSGTEFTFWADEKPFEATPFRIPYRSVTDLEYGQKAGRRVGAAIAAAVLLTPLGLLALMSKKRSHFLTIAYRDDAGADQVAVFEIGKDIVRASLAIIETRSGRPIQYQDSDARESGGPGAGTAPAAAGERAADRSAGEQPATSHHDDIKAMTNADVLKLLQVGVSDDVIVVAIRSARRKQFDVQPVTLVELKNAGVSNAVLHEMQTTSPQAVEAIHQDDLNRRPPGHRSVCVIFWCR
jgi:hypothetical protein